MNGTSLGLTFFITAMNKGTAVEMSEAEVSMRWTQTALGVASCFCILGTSLLLAKKSPSSDIRTPTQLAISATLFVDMFNFYGTLAASHDPAPSFASIYYLPLFGSLSKVGALGLDCLLSFSKECFNCTDLTADCCKL